MMLAASAYAQKFTDSLLLHIPTSNNVADNGPNNYTVSPTSVAYGNDYRSLANQAVVCNGSSTRVAITTSAKFQHALPMTVSVWVNITTQTGNLPVFYGADNYNVYSGIWLQVIDGYLYANMGDGQAAGTGNRYSVRSTNKLSVSTWYNITAVFKTGAIDLYINGTKDESTTASGGATTMAWMGVAASYGFASKSGGYNYFSGSLDNLMVWGRALSETEIKIAKNLVYFGEMGNTVKDFGPTTSIATKSGTTADFDRLGNTNGGLKFNGSSDKLTLPANANYKPTFPFTISAWVYSESKTGIVPIVATTDHQVDYYNGASLWVENGYPCLYIGDGGCKGANCRSTYLASDSIKINRWNLVTAVVTAYNNIKIYINGTAVSGGALSGTGTTMSNSASIPGTIGYLTDAYATSNRYFKGIIDEVLIANVALTAPDVNSLYANSLYVSQHPANVTADQGTSQFIACAGAGTGAVTYQWQRYTYGSGWANHSAATKKTVVFNSLSAADTGLYRCVITMGSKNVTTNAALVKMTIPVNGVVAPIHTLALYPNPANQKLKISTGLNTTYTISIINMAGSVVLEKAGIARELELDINAIAAGSYVVRVASAQGVYQTNLQVQR